MKGMLYFTSEEDVFEAGRKFMVFSTTLGKLDVSSVKSVGRLDKLKHAIGCGGKKPMYSAEVKDGLTEGWIAILSTKGCIVEPEIIKE